MKILVFNWQDWTHPFAGGAEVHLREVFTRIAAAGHHVTLLCSTHAGAPVEEDLDGIRIVRTGSRNLFNLRPPIEYLSRFRGERFDVVVEDMNKIPFFSPIYVRDPLVCVTHHLFGTSIFRETHPAAGLYVYVTELLAVRLFRSRGTHFIVGSTSTMDELVANGCKPENVSVVHYAYDASLYGPGGTKSVRPLIGYLGRLKRYKSVHHLLQALPEVVARHPDLRVAIMGEGDDRPRLEGLARKLGLTGAVEFTGFVPPGRKVDLLRSMWCMVMPSSKEGWGLTVIEANACGTPVIASRVPGLREAVRDGETGLLYDYGDTDALASSIDAMLQDAARREEFSRRALDYARTFTWDRAARETLDVLVRIAAEVR